MLRRLRLWLVLSMALSVMVVAASASALSEGPDYDLPNGHFFTQTNGQPGAGTTGYAITNDDGIPFWTEYQKLGGPAALGYPVSKRFMYDGFVTQAMQKVVFQWRPEVKQVWFLNTFDELHDNGKNNWLLNFWRIPQPFDTAPDAGLSWDQVVQRHLLMLDAIPEIKKVYLADSDPLSHFGLPMAYADMGTSLVVRAQRSTFQYWKQDVLSAKKGDVTIANGGELAKGAGLWPAAAVVPDQSPLGAAAPAPSSPVASAPSGPAATVTPVPTAAPTQAPAVAVAPTAAPTQPPAPTAAPTAAPTQAPAPTVAAPANTAGSGKDACLACHGPFDKLVSATAGYVWSNGDKQTPHRYVPHASRDSKAIPECSNCHKAHPLPPTAAGIAAMGKADPQWCFTCHHTGDLKCGSCHAVP